MNNSIYFNIVNHKYSDKIIKKIVINEINILKFIEYLIFFNE